MSISSKVVNSKGQIIALSSITVVPPKKEKKRKKKVSASFWVRGVILIPGPYNHTPWVSKEIAGICISSESWSSKA